MSYNTERGFVMEGRVRKNSGAFLRAKEDQPVTIRVPFVVYTGYLTTDCCFRCSGTQWVCMSHKNFLSKLDKKTIDKLLACVKPIRKK